MADRPSNPVASFIVAACVPRNASHASGTTDEAARILAAHPEVATANIHSAAILGDDATVRRFIALDAASATATGGPHGWDALTHLCFSNYLKEDCERKIGAERFVRAATALLDAGASANTGWFEEDHEPSPEWEPVLYGACGVAHHPELTRLLLERGANPNDNEVVYHSPETWDNTAMQLLVETGKLTDENLSMMLIRKHDFHDYDGAKYLLEHGARPNRQRERGWHPFHHALARDNSLEMIALLLDHGADPLIEEKGVSGIALAAREGRSDLLELFTERGIEPGLAGVDRLIAACAMGDTAAARAIAKREPAALGDMLAMGGTLLAKFAGTCNPPGVRALLDLGVEVAAPFEQGDGYFGEPPNSLAIHVAAWRGHSSVVKLLIERGSPVDVPDERGMTPLLLAVRACVDSYWTERRSPDSVKALLEAGASVRGVRYPSGYHAVDALLAPKLT